MCRVDSEQGDNPSHRGRDIVKINLRRESDGGLVREPTLQINLPYAVSRSVFAAVLNTSVSTVQKWEIGGKKPSGPSLKLLHLLQHYGLEATL